MRAGREIDWARLLTGVLAYEQPFAALDGERFERIARGFAGHYEIEWLGPDRFGFARGEGYTPLPRLDAFGYVDRGTVTRLRNEEIAIDDAPANVAVLPAGWRAIGFTLSMRVVLIFWAFLIAALYFALFDHTPALYWIGGFVLIAALYIALVVRSLDAKLARWMARESFN